MNSFSNLVQTISVVEPVYTAAETPLMNKLKNDVKNNFESAVRNGLEPEKIVKMVSIMSLLIQNGITPDDLQNHQQLFVTLCMDSDFSIMDTNINHILCQINLAKNS